MKTAVKNNSPFSILKSRWINPFGGLFKNDFNNRDLSEPETVPCLNIIEEDNNYKVQLAAPGLEKEDFKIQVADDILTISREKKTEKTDFKEEHFARVEYNYSNFTRSLSLPQNTNAGQIMARYVNGILTLEIPKRGVNEKFPAQEIKVE